MITSTAFNSIIIFLKMLFGFMVTKYVALVGGPSAIAYLGQIQSAVTIFQNLPSGISNGIVANTPESKKKSQLGRLWFTAFGFGIFIFFILILSLLFKDSISGLFSNSDGFSRYYVILVLSFPFYYLYSISNAINTSQEKFNIYFLSNIVSMVVYVTLMSCFKLIYDFGDIYLWLILFFPFCSILVFSLTLYDNYRNFSLAFDLKIISCLSKYFGLALVSAIYTPLIVVAVRNILFEYFGSEITGYWQAMWRISEIYTSVLMLSLSTIILPKFARASNRVEILEVFKKSLMLVMPMYCFASVLILSFDSFVFELLYRDGFKIYPSALLVQVIGDFFKIICWLVTYYLLSKSKLLILLVLEVFFGLFFIVSSWFSLRLELGINGISYSYLLTQLLCTACLFYVLNKFLMKVDHDI